MSYRNIASYDTKFNMETFNLEVERKIFDNLKLPKSLKKLYEINNNNYNNNKKYIQRIVY